MNSSSRLQALDALRAFAVLLVIAYHTSYRFPPESWDPVARMLRVTGWMGVDLFFALSGFLIGTILMREKNRRDMAAFARKRFFRIVPIYLVAVAVFAVADMAVAGGENVGRLWKALLFLTGYLLPFQGEAAVPYTITWSLSVEVSAYVLLGLLAFAAWRHFRAVLWAVVLASPFMRITLAYGAGWQDAAIGVFPPVRLDAIALGALAALGSFDRLLSIRRPALVYGVLTVGLIVGFRFAAWISPFTSTIGLSLFGVAAALWVAALARQDTGGGPVLRLLASVGTVSYFMYLFHLFFIEALMILDGRLGGILGFWPAFAIASTLTYGAGLVSWRLFEAPLIRHAATQDRQSGLARNQ